MPVIALDSLDDSHLAAYRALRDPELARRLGLFVAEGRLVVARLVAMQRFSVESLLLNHAAQAAMGESLAGLPEAVPVFVCPIEQFAVLTGVNVHRGCLALVKRPSALSLDAVIANARTVIGLEGVSNPDNVGGIFRNAAAFSADAILLGPGCCDPYYRKAIRTSMGATLRVPFVRPVSALDALLRLREQGFVLAALTPDRSSVSIDAFAAGGRPERLALLFGAEGEGLSADVLRMADVRVRIPIAGDVDSLNVGVASGIAMSRLLPAGA